LGSGGHSGGRARLEGRTLAVSQKIDLLENFRLETAALVGRRTQRSTIGDRAFAAAAPAVWNSLS